MKTIIRLAVIILLTAFILTCTTTPVPDFGHLGKPDDKVPLTSRALTGTLPNGLRYFILENSRPENRAHVALVVNAGSVLEREYERGFAHFVEHLAFKGTARFPEMELIDYLRSLGMRFGPDANAYTSYNETVYHFDVPVETINGVKRIPHRALAILDDWTFAVSFNPEDVASESIVVLEELRARLGAMERVRRRTLPVLFAGSAYENREPIGLANVIENATPDQLRAFYSRWYTADNMALIFVGDFDGKALEAELVDHFNMPSPVQPVNRPLFDLPPPVNNNFHVEIITDPELTGTSFNIYYKQRQGAKRGTLAYYRDSIIDYLIDTMLNLRFEETATDPDAAATNSWGGTWRWATNSRFYMLGTQAKTGSAEEALRELLLEKESMRRFGFTESELQRAKTSLLSFMERQLSERDRRESRNLVRGFTSHFLYGEDMADIEWEMDAVLSLLPGITLREVSARAANYFAANDCVVFLIAPQAEAQNLPSRERIREIFRETSRARIIPRQDKSLSGDLLSVKPVPGSIVSETTDAQTGAVIITLNNGARVILKETTNRNNEIVMYAMARGGTVNAAEDTIVSVNLLSEMILVSGLGPYSRMELINKLTGKQVSVSFWASNYNRGFQGSSTTQDITTLFEMLHLFFTDPGLDERAVAAMIDQYRTTLAHQEENPGRFFSREISRLKNNNHPLFMPLEPADMDRVSVSAAFDFLSRCINPGDYTFVFSGNINPDVMRELSSMYIASIPNASSMNNWTNPGIIRPQQGRRTIYRGVDERSIVYLAWFAGGLPDFNEKRNQTAAILSEYLDIMLIDEIREKMSGVYSISSGVSVSVIPAGEYSLEVYFVCDPARAEELIAAVQERITEIFTMPLNRDTFNKAREALLKQHENSLQRNLHIAQSYANSAVLFYTPLNRLNLRPDVIQSVTMQDVQELCRQILVNGAVQLVMFPQGWE
jgi:zinc protease